jgi:hypothetical protein
MASQNRQQPGSQQIPLHGGIGAEIGQRTVVDPCLHQPGQVQELDEKGHLSKRRHGRVVVPAHLDPSTRRVHPGHRLGDRFAQQFHRPVFSTFDFTHQVISLRSDTYMDFNHIPPEGAGQPRFLGLRVAGLIVLFTTILTLISQSYKESHPWRSSLFNTNTVKVPRLYVTVHRAVLFAFVASNVGVSSRPTMFIEPTNLASKIKLSKWR